jgi:hypothetical protein
VFHYAFTLSICLALEGLKAVADQQIRGDEGVP